MRRAVQGIGLALGLLCAAPMAAQDLRTPTNTAILTIDSDRLFLNSDFGKRVAREIEASGNELAAENRRIEAELAEAEQDLTDRRASMTPEAFRPLADAFDTRVQETRQAQAAKSRNLNALLDQEREIFLSAAVPVLQELMAEVGAAVILERRTVFISSNSSDITSAAIARLNTKLGEGENVTPAPQGDSQD
ncbi:OmpH family outer membrane protein [Sulfitobacter sp. F26169L]|uniref:OmpH family outer membrane protein n=1 Tax=Sulfitobacter sp. F26169L TaxID=2996015 RepID=UPI002260A3B2|nr:OmpH family outer membrane protein [Sulfitobacter sp. F26169L]MCX7565334.1 OmpH family outer membrane protein [Sulfitobacter sp. F26169L]